MKVIDLFGMHLSDVLERIAAKKLAQKTAKDYSKLLALIANAGLSETDADILGPAHFAKLMQEIESHGYSLRTQKNIISSFKSVFNWAGPDGMNLCERPAYGPRFKSPPSRAIEAEQEAGPSRFIDGEVILRLLDLANPRMKVAILFGINCGFYPSDTIEITLDKLHLDHIPPFHDMRRVKTLQQRKAVLWPETVHAVEDYVHIDRVRPPDMCEHNTLITANGEPYSQTGDKMAGSFKRLLKRAGHSVRGVSLGSLRHTYATVIDTVPDQAMIDLTMGHTNPSIQKRTYRQLNTNEFDRLEAIADTVHLWLYGR